MTRQRPTRTDPDRTARRRGNVRRKPRSAGAPGGARSDEPPPSPPVTADDLAPLDEDDLRALKSGWGFVE